MQKSSTTPDEHLASLADDVRDDMRTLDAAIAGAMRGEERVLWEGKFWGGSDQRIIGYGEYTYKGRSGRTGTWFVVGLARQKNYITVFVNAVADGAYLAERYADRLGKVKVGRSSISFKNLEAVDLDTLIELIATARKTGIASA